MRGLGQCYKKKVLRSERVRVLWSDLEPTKQINVSLLIACQKISKACRDSKVETRVGTNTLLPVDFG